MTSRTRSPSSNWEQRYGVHWSWLLGWIEATNSICRLPFAFRFGSACLCTSFEGGKKTGSTAPSQPGFRCAKK